MKNKKVMSIAIRPELEEMLKKSARRKGMSASSYVTDLVEQAVKISPDDDVMVIGRPVDEDVIPIVLKMPAGFKNDIESLKKWIAVQMNGIVKAMEKKQGAQEPSGENS